MTDEGMLERIATRRAEPVVAGRVVQGISEQGFGEYLSLPPPAPEVQVGGRSVLLIPARAAGIDPDVLPQDYQRLVAIVREAAGPVTVRAVGEPAAAPAKTKMVGSSVKIRLDLGQSMPSTMRKSRSTPSERATSASW
ncbi:hypothetical protein ABT150_40680 [Streptomyces mirabilis]|uniref:hypothetical protein n=1 Tax=Streptomyces mirabilis TaxID=68239 RepID=UPI00332645C7